MMLIAVIGIGFLIYYLNSNGKMGTGSSTGKGSAEELLKARFVNGEIDEKTYLQMKETIKG